MKKYFFLLLAISFVTTVFQSCQLDTCSEKQIYTKWTPIYKRMNEIRLEVVADASQQLVKPGKIYFYNNYVFINEIKEGIHVIDNKDPANPRNVAFIKIPGNVDIAVKDNILYADNYIDLLSIDITNPEKPILIQRDEFVFANPVSINQFGNYLVDYLQTNETITIDCNSPNWGKPNWEYDSDIFFTSNASTAGGVANSGSTGQTPNGIGGSMARFTIASDHLYLLDRGNMKIFNVQNAKLPIFKKAIDVQNDIETLFPYKDNLFIGSNSGMLIYSIKTPENPVQLSVFQHARACDPVFVNNDIAYVTLHDGTACQGFQNQLEVYDVKDLKAPKLIKIYPMQHPHGLSIEENTMYLCEGRYGLKSFDIKDLSNIDNNKIATFSNFNAYDVIALPKDYAINGKKIVMVIGTDGFYQYDATDAKNLKKLSLIPISK